MNERIYELLTRHLQGELTEADRSELGHWMDQSEGNRSIAEEFLNDDQLKEALKNVVSKKIVWQRVQEGIDERIVPMRKRWIKWVAAACVLFVVCGLWFVVSRNSEVGGRKSEIAKTQDVPAPSNTRAVITLADGSKVYLDSAGNGTLAQQGDVNVVKNANGQIIYSPDHQITKSPDISYNTLYNPRGSKVISLTLSDGTKVWLNSESSLRYPASFALTAGNREVEITGEAYFEVKHNAKQPFKVHLPNGSVIEDIGTSFNVNAYTDEASIKTTLIEGSVRILSPGHQITGSPNNESPDHHITKSQILKPGEQLVQSPDHQITTSPDIDEVMAWKNGYFQFTNRSIQDIMKQMARWYDVDVVFENEITEGLNGTIPRNVPASEFFKIMELTGKVHFRTEGKKIIVTK